MEKITNELEKFKWEPRHLSSPTLTLQPTTAFDTPCFIYFITIFILFGPNVCFPKWLWYPFWNSAENCYHLLIMGLSS